MSISGRFAQRLIHLALSSALAGGLLVAASPAQAYAPGQASVVGLEYNVYSGAWEYSCKFSNWRSDAKVVYYCRLYGLTASAGYTLLDNNKGTWTPPPKTITRGYDERVPIGSGSICIRAYAYSVDGTADSGYKICRFSL